MSTIRCPKCCSSILYQERDRTFEPDPWILACLTCGHRIYGEQDIINLVKEQVPHLLETFSAHLSIQSGKREGLLRPSPKPPPAKSQTPRRGPVLVYCCLCGLGIWRRPYDVKTSPNKRFFCCREHLTEFKRRVTVAVKSNERVDPRARVEGKNGKSKVKGGPPSRRRGAIKVHCALCHTPVWRRPWDVKSCKSGLFFCSREHHRRWQQDGERPHQHAPLLPSQCEELVTPGHAPGVTQAL